MVSLFANHTHDIDVYALQLYTHTYLTLTGMLPGRVGEGWEKQRVPFYRRYFCIT